MMTLSVGGWKSQTRTNEFQFEFFVSMDALLFFHQLRVGAKNTTLPLFPPAHTHSALASNLQNFFLASPLTRHSSTADTKVSFSIPPLARSSFHFFPPLPTPSNKENWKSFQFQGETTFYFYPCVLKAQILMTLTLNENEVAINYIKYDFLRCFFGATL